MRHRDAVDRLPELLGMHSTSPDEAALRAHVAECADCRARLATLEAIEAELRRFDDETPSAALDARVRDIPLREEDDAPVTLPAPARRPMGRAWLPAFAASTLAMLVAAFTLAFSRGGTTQQPFVAEHTIALASDSPKVHATLAMGHATGSNQPIRLQASGLSSTDAGYYTLWLMDDTHHMMAATFRPEGDGTCVVMGAVPRDMAWTEAAITRSDTPPTTHDTMVAAGKF